MCLKFSSLSFVSKIIFKRKKKINSRSFIFSLFIYYKLDYVKSYLCEYFMYSNFYFISLYQKLYLKGKKEINSGSLIFSLSLYYKLDYVKSYLCEYFIYSNF